MIIKYYNINILLFVKSLKYFELERLIIFTASRNTYICKILFYIYIKNKYYRYFVKNFSISNIYFSLIKFKL